MYERLTERNANGTAKSRKSPKSSYMGTVYEEMALVLSEGGCGKTCDCIQGDKFNCHLLYNASVLYNAGYRKIYDDHQRQCTCYALGCQMAEGLKRDVAREIFEDCHNTLIKILGVVRDGLDKAIREDNEEAKLVHIGTEETVKCIILIFAELKKKYTECKNG